MTRLPTLWILFVLGALALATACDGAITGHDDAVGDDDAVAPDGGGPGPGPDGLPADPLARRPGLVVYWGQNGWGGAHPGDMATWEAPLADVCRVPEYDVVVLGFVTTFQSARNGGLPETNFSYHCEEAVDAAHPFLLSCPEIAAGIETCHANGKKVLLSLGGAAGAYGFGSDDDARAFADTTWDLFLGGDGVDGVARPFGATPLDGVDLDIEGGGPTGYAAFVTRLRERMDARGGDWLITAAPQCPFPDAHLGPTPGTALGDAASAFDYVFVQFYNNYCAASSGAAFTETWNQWSALAASGGPRVVVGLPATPAAAPAGGYVAPEQLGALVDQVKGSSAFAGLMLWDVSFDQNSDAGSGRFGQRAVELLR